MLLLLLFGVAAVAAMAMAAVAYSGWGERYQTHPNHVPHWYVLDGESAICFPRQWGQQGR